MRAVRHSLAFALLSLAVVLAGRALAQAESAEPPEELTVRGQRSLGEYRLELERARDNIVRIFNAANEGTDTDVTCRAEQPTGTRMRHTACRSEAENRAQAESGRRFLNSLTLSAKATFARLGFGGEQILAQSNLGTANQEQAAKVGAGDALAEFEAEWKRIISENRDLYDAVVKYVELEDEYARARGETIAPLPDLMRGSPVEPIAQQVCEASTLTEYVQRNDVARVSGTVSLSSCPAGTTGSFTVVARVLDDAGETRTLEFAESWQRADAEDHLFDTEYPIGENVFLQSVRVRNLTCTCSAPAQ